MKNPFKTGDEAYILDKKVKVSSLNESSVYVMIDGLIHSMPYKFLSFTPYTAQGITHERPKPAGMFWDDNKQKGVYGILMGTGSGEYIHISERTQHWKNFEEMTFDEYRKLKNL